MCKYEFLRKEEKKNGLDGMDNDCNHNSRHYYVDGHVTCALFGTSVHG